MINKNTYGLSIKEAVGIMILYYVIIAGFIALPLDMVIHRVNFGSHLFIKELIFCINDLIFKVSVIILLLRYVKKRGAEKLKFHDNLNIKLLIVTVVIFLSYGLVCANSIDILLAKIPVDDSTIKSFDLLNQNVYLNFLTAVIVAPITEEIIMRGIILEGLLKKYSPFIAIVSSSLIFGIAHFNIPQFISAFLGGMILGAVYFKTRSLILTMAGHACNNMMNFFNIPINIIALVGGLIILALAAFIFVKNINKTSEITKVESMVSYAKTGVDETVNLNLEYDYIYANIQCSISAKMPEDIYIYGDKGYIVMKKLHFGNVVRLYDISDKLAEEFVMEEGNGFIYQVKAAMSCIENGKLESDIAPHKMTLECAKVFDHCLNKL